MRVPKRNLVAPSLTLAVAFVLTLDTLHAGHACDLSRRDETPQRLSLQPCKVPGVEEELLCGKLLKRTHVMDALLQRSV